MTPRRPLCRLRGATACAASLALHHALQRSSTRSATTSLCSGCTTHLVQASGSCAPISPRGYASTGRPCRQYRSLSPAFAAGQAGAASPRKQAYYPGMYSKRRGRQSNPSSPSIAAQHGVHLQQESSKDVTPSHANAWGTDLFHSSDRDASAALHTVVNSPCNGFACSPSRACCA
jgi:hypothetical protein